MPLLVSPLNAILGAAAEPKPKTPEVTVVVTPVSEVKEPDVKVAVVPVVVTPVSEVNEPDVKVAVVPAVVVPVRVVKVAVGAVTLPPEIVPVTVRAPDVEKNKPETVINLSVPPLSKVMLSTLIVP
jgi:hypothetical protein